MNRKIVGIIDWRGIFQLKREIFLSKSKYHTWICVSKDMFLRLLVLESWLFVFLICLCVSYLEIIWHSFERD